MSYCKRPTAVAECFAGSVCTFLEQSRIGVDDLEQQSCSETEFFNDFSWRLKTAKLSTLVTLQRIKAKHKDLPLAFCRSLLLYSRW